MATRESYDVEELQEEMEEEASIAKEDDVLDQMELTKEEMEAYGAPEPEERQNQHTLLHKAAFGTTENLKTTWLSESELGRPLFNVRFMLKMNLVSHYYLDPVLKKLNIDPEKYNAIANYFKDDVQNVSASGMSNKGFLMNLNVTRKVDAVRKRVKETATDQKGGVK